ncbi:sensor domain-containing diguanylate cyclase [Candidatus Izemoplasma sp. B36]|uniref:sensor domain-containing diguanylate cyclase n=1 Tax=Candidatus Izemoplasma sp. B36 TaxID=3242468 RepID=UPI003556688B
MKKKNFFHKSVEYMRNITVSGSSYKYGLFYGFIALIFLLLKQVFSFIFYDSTDIEGYSKYIVVFIILFVLLSCFLIIYILKLNEKNFFARNYIMLYPYFFIILGVFISNLYLDNLDLILSMVVIVIMLTWIQIYKITKRMLVYSSIIIFFYLYQFVFDGNNTPLFENSSFILMLTFISFLVSTVYCQVYNHNQNAIKTLNEHNDNINLVIQDLKKTYEDLTTSKKITRALYEMTQEVLKNEKIENLMQLILDKAISFIPNGQAGSILILDNNKMKFVAAKGYKIENLKKVVLYPEDLFQATLDDKFQPTVIKNLEVFDENHLGKEKTLKLKEESAVIAKSCLTCSFKLAGEFFGSINIDNFDGEDIFVEKDMDLIKQFTEEIEIILSIHNLYEKALRPTKYDDLTEAKTRKYSMKLINDLINRGLKNVISICTIDINNLKKTNDLYGHDIGDKYLEYFSRTIIDLDIEDNIFGRIGGDEFILVFDKLNKEKATKEILKIKKAFKENPLKFEENSIEISFSVGVSEYPFDSENIDDLIKLSDKRMYKDKNIQKLI